MENTSGISFFLILTIILSLLYFISIWIIFRKTGRKGIISLVPIYNLWTYFEISNLKGWYSVVPIANIIMIFIANYKLAILFNYSSSFALLNSIFPIIGLPIIAFSKTKYDGYIEEPISNSNESAEPAYISSEADHEFDTITTSEENFEYKAVKNTKIENIQNDNINPIVDYSIKTEESESTITKQEPENKFIQNEEEKIEIVEL